VENETDLVRRLLVEEFGDDRQRDALRHLHAAYYEAAATTHTFDRAQRRKVYGHARLALIEQSFKVMANKYPDMLGTDARIEHGTYEYFTLTTKSLVITLSAVRSPDKLPRPAIFRDTLASGVNYSLFPEPLGQDGRRYFHVLLLHSIERRFELDAKTRKVVERRRLDRPGFCEMVVPTRDGLSRLLTMSLFAQHPQVISDLRGLNQEDVKATKLRRRHRKTDEEQGQGAGA
jgi:hypothetical protein